MVHNPHFSYVQFLIMMSTCSYFSGFQNKDVAFLHKASKTLIVADLLMNLPAKEQVNMALPPMLTARNSLSYKQYSKSKQSTKSHFIGDLHPYRPLYQKMLWTLGTNKEFVWFRS
jgi:hypothetical protein